MTDIEIMKDAYIEAAYFTETGDTGQPDADAELTTLFKAQAWIDCSNFYSAVTEKLGVRACDIDWSQAGHDLWLTRNSHGVGFWDREDIVYGWLGDTELKTILTAMAKALGGHDAEFIEETTTEDAPG